MITLLQKPPHPVTGQYWRGYDAKPEFHRRKVQIISVQNSQVLVGFCDTLDDDDDFKETGTFPESMFSNLITGYAYFSADNK